MWYSFDIMTYTYPYLPPYTFDIIIHFPSPRPPHTFLLILVLLQKLVGDVSRDILQLATQARQVTCQAVDIDSPQGIPQARR